MTINQEITFEEYDEFNRKEIAEKIIKLLKSTIDVSPLVIDGDWGTGKTEFTYKLINLFKEGQKPKEEVGEQQRQSENKIYSLVYIDAYKADHADEPLMTILSALINAFPDIKEKKDLRKKAMSVLKFGTKTILKGGVNWVLRQDSVDIANDFDDEIKKAFDKSIDRILSIHEKSEEKIKALVEVMEKITKENPVIIFIDELDRCRPNFAIKMLENIKHIFDIVNLKFVLVANLNQIRSSINHCYGASVNSQSYLDKFLGFTFGLPQTIPMSNQKCVSCSHFKRLLRGSELNTTTLIQEDYIDFFEKIIIVNKLTLRQVETFIKYLNIYQVVSNNELSESMDFGIMMLIIFGIYLFCFEPDLVADINHGVIDAVELNKLLGKKKLFKIGKENIDSYCENSDKIAYAIYKESNKNKSEFGYLEDNEEEQWKSAIGTMFTGHLGRSLPIIGYIEFVIRKFQLGEKS